MRYPGGKGRCFKHIISLMKAHSTYIETHLGGGAVMRAKRPAARNIGVEIDPRVVARWTSLARPPCEIVQGDAIEFLRSYRYSGDELVYADPPYLVETRLKRWIYRHDYSAADHANLLTTLSGLPCAVMVSGYRNRLYEEMLTGWRSVEFRGDSHAGPRVEVVWMNYADPAVLHDAGHIGGGFRQREQIRRRRDGLTRRIGALDLHERHALFDALAARHAAEMRDAIGRRE